MEKTHVNLPNDLPRPPARRDFLRWAGLGAASLALGPVLARARARKKRPPNIVFILADDLGWRDARVYGSTYYRTPNIDRLAARGMRFTDAYAAAPICSPTRASILTGQYPARLRFTTPAGHLPQVILDPVVPETAPPDRKICTPQSRTRLPNTTLTLAEVLAPAGYATGFFGKWHLGRPPYSPWNQGFETTVGGCGYPGPPPPGHYFSPWACKTIPKQPPGTHICDVLTSAAVRFIEKHRNQPFFLDLCYYDVHAPFQSKKRLIEKYRKLARPNAPQHCPTMAAMIEVLDAGVGRVVAALDRLGLMQNTLLVFFSDNGGNMYDRVDGTTPTNNAPLRGGKATIYEGGVREPCIVVWPGHVKPGSVSREIITSVDFFPTFLDVLGLPRPRGTVLDGVSILPALRGGRLPTRPIFCHFPHNVRATGNIASTSVRLGDWKLIRFWFDGPGRKHRYELYNLKTDIGETRNLAAQHPEIVRRLDALITHWLADTRALVPKLNPNYRKTIRGWRPNQYVKMECRAGALRLHCFGKDPFIVNASVPKATGRIQVELEMEAKSRGNAQFFWATAAPHEWGFHRSRRITFPVVHDQKPHWYRFAFTARGPLARIRLDPCPAGPGEIAVRRLRLLDRRGRVLKDWDFTKPAPLPDSGVPYAR